MKYIKYLFFFIIINSFIYPQNTYYVSPYGSNSNSGLSINDAFQTLQHAADIVGPGDSVIVLEGTYAGFDLRTNGTENSPIVFKAENKNVIINQKNPVINDGINIESAGWVVIDGFTVINQPRAGIRIVTSDFVTIKNNICSDNYRWGIFTGFTDDILIENNICSGSEDEHGIYVSNSSDRPKILNNHCFNNNACGIHMNGDISMGGDGIISNAVVAGNIIHSNGTGGGSAINMDGVQESYIYNNLIYNNFATGIAMYKIDGAEGSKNNKVFNNTIVSPSNTRWNILVVNGSTGNTLYNNILINNHNFRGSISIDESSLENFVSDYNILENRLSNDDGNSNISLSEWQVLGYDLHSVIADDEEEIFMDHTSGDFHLLPNSQPVNFGTSLVASIVLTDIENVLRPQGSGYDAGAFEFLSTTDVKEEINVKNFKLYQNYPNPFNPATTISWYSPVSGIQTLKVYDILGREVATLINEERPAGYYEVEFSAASLENSFVLSSGIFFYRLTIDNYSETKKFQLIK